ncbi:DUF5615 family PIN-like protein [Candidatus Woesearchaeota archaeon]|nr:DUF5615 family PIN-like protein [Candidatus Woesearchaeota archaeon]
MRFLTDENIATSVFRSLRQAGHDVKDVKESRLQGASDNELLRLARDEDRIIVTHDKDFGQVLQASKIQHCGILFLRLYNQQPQNVQRVLLTVLASPVSNKMQKNVVIVSEAKVTVHRT